MKKYCKWILLTITLVAIVLLIISAILNKTTDDNTLNVQNTVVNANEIFRFKIFEYVVPTGLKFTDYGAKRFKIEGNDWYAIVGMIYDDKMSIYDDIEDFQSIIVKVGRDYSIVTDSVITVDDTKIITFKDEHGGGLLCYFASSFGIDYEVEIFNNDRNYKANALNEFIETLLNVTYENDGTNDFYITYFKADDEDDDTTN